ncbi:MAG: thioesterase family protein [Balneolales bacterium]
MQLRSRYSETDKMGVVYHSRFLEYFEVVRTEFIRAAGLPYGEMERSGVMLPVARAEIQYKRPILYDELMDAQLMVFDQPNVKLITWYDIRTTGSQQPCVLGKVDLVFVDAKTRRPMRVPDIFLTRFNNYARLA